MKYLLFFSVYFLIGTLHAQTAPELPNTSDIETCFPDTTGYAVLTVGPAGRDYGDLQAAINAANPGTVLVLDAGVTFTGTFTLPNKTGAGWIVIMSSRMDLLPAQGQRIRPDGATGDSAYPGQRAAMPKIVSANPSGQPCFRTQAAAHHYRLVGLEIAADTSVLNNYGLIFFGDASAAQSTLNAVPHHLVVDRCYIHGPNDGTFLKIGDPSDVLLEHNTVLQTGPITWAYDTTLNMTFRDNIFHCFVSAGGYQGIYGPGFGPGGNGPMGRYFPGITDANLGFHQNLLIGGNAQHYSNYNTLSQNFFPANTGLVQFADYANGGTDYLGFALSGSSPWKNAATGGTDPGVDFARLDSALNARSGCAPAVETHFPFFAAADVRLFPNPFSGRLMLNSSMPLSDAELVVYDLAGREIFRAGGLSGQYILVNTGRVTPGACLCLLRQEGRVLHRQLLVAE